MSWYSGAGCRGVRVHSAVCRSAGVSGARCRVPRCSGAECRVPECRSVGCQVPGAAGHSLAVPFLRVTLGHPVLSAAPSDRRQRREIRPGERRDGSQSDTQVPSGSPPNDNTPPARRGAHPHPILRRDVPADTAGRPRGQRGAERATCRHRASCFYCALAFVGFVSVGRAQCSG